MKIIIALALGLSISISAVNAHCEPQPFICQMTAVQEGEPLPVNLLEDYAPDAPPAKKKEIWSIRHPKMHKAGRKFRKLCQISGPALGLGVNVAQGIAWVISLL